MGGHLPSINPAIYGVHFHWVASVSWQPSAAFPQCVYSATVRALPREIIARGGQEGAVTHLGIGYLSDQREASSDYIQMTICRTDQTAFMHTQW